ncbi:MAG: tetratricopeptide repeat protein [Anaerolineae bacterium]|nr:tetratricopeptide repeat protein [Anaerolineae bacterium]
MVENRQSEVEQLEEALAALEGQRPLLGDDVVDTALLPLQEKLASLRPRGEEERKQLTVLFARVGGLGALQDEVAVEETNQFFRQLWPRLDAIVRANGGTVDKHSGTLLMALFGTPVAHEDDPRRAVRTALQMQQVVANFDTGPFTGLPLEEGGLHLQAGLNTGPAVVGSLGRTREVTAVGDAVNLASRLADTAAPGTVIVSHATYRHVRGFFNANDMPPLWVKGKREPVVTYLVKNEKPRAFPLEPQPVAGLESETVGREAEMALLRDTLQEVMATGTPRVITVVGEAGVGKSRLLYELQNWMELVDEVFRLFRGQAELQSAAMPYALVRNMLAFRFQIKESDSPAVARHKLENGVTGVLGEAGMETAHFIGHLTGFDFSDSHYLRGILDDPRQIQGRAFHYFAEYLRVMAAETPVVLMLENMQWVDAGSVALAEYLWQNCQDCPILIVVAARTAFVEHGPPWLPHARQDPHHRLLDLAPLGEEESRQLVRNILRKLPNIPAALEGLIVEKAAGNPFYIEEMVRMLIDDGVLVPGEESWHLRLERLVPDRVPPTLTGVLQARLDALTAAERDVLQRAAVVGEQFWDGAVAALRALASSAAGGLPAVSALLALLEEKEMVVRHGQSAFPGSSEYRFKHAILHSVTYENVLLRRRRSYHGAIAAWLIDNAGERAEEYAGLIGSHWEQAGEQAEAAQWYARAAHAAERAFLPGQAIGYYEKALEFLPPGNDYAALRAELYQGLGDMLWRQARRSEAVAMYQAMRETAAAANDLRLEARACNHLARVHRYLGEMHQGMGFARQAEVLAGRSGPEATVELARAVATQGWNHHGLGQFEEAIACGERALALSRSTGKVQEIALALNLLGVCHTALGEHERGAHYGQEALELYRRVGHRWGVGIISNNLGENARARGDFETALRYYEDALAIARETGNRESAISCFNNMGGVRLALGAPEAAEEALREVLARVGDRGWFGLAESYRYLAAACLAQGRAGEGLEAAQRSLQLAREGGHQEFVGAAWRMLGRVAAATGRSVAPAPDEPPASAADCYQHSAAIFEEAGMAVEHAHTLYAWGACLQRTDPEAGARLQQEAEERFAALGLPLDVVKMEA